MSLDVLQAIAEPTRYAILSMLRTGPLPAGRIAAGFDITRSAVSQHLAILREAGVVIQEAQGTRRIYRIDRANLVRLIDELTLLVEPAVSADSPQIDPRPTRANAHEPTPDSAGAAPVPAHGVESRPAPSSGALLDDAPARSPTPTPISPAAVPASPVLLDQAAEHPGSAPDLDRHVEVEAEISIRADPWEVFRCLTDAGTLMDWFAADARAEAHPGGLLQLSDGHDLVMIGAYQDLEVGSRVVFTWGGVEGLSAGETRVELSLRTTATGTDVRLRHSLLPRRLAATYQNVWRHSVLPNLRDAAEGRRPTALCLGVRSPD